MSLVHKLTHDAIEFFSGVYSIGIMAKAGENGIHKEGVTGLTAPTAVLPGLEVRSKVVERLQKITNSPTYISISSTSEGKSRQGNSLKFVQCSRPLAALLAFLFAVEPVRITKRRV